MRKDYWRKMMMWDSAPNGRRYREALKSKSMARRNIMDAEINCARAKIRAHMAANIMSKIRG